VSTATPKRLDIVAIGEAMVEFNQARSDDPSHYLQGFGGDTSNAVIAAARQGAACAYLSRVGGDVFGDQLLQLWRSEGVDTGGVVVDDQAPTGIYFVHHHEGEHRFSYRRAGSAASLMTGANLPLTLIPQAKILHASAISQAISVNACEVVLHAMQQAREHGVVVAYDPNLRLALWPLARARAVITATLALVDEFLPSIDDLRPVCGLTQPQDILQWAHDHGARRVVLKLGSDGSLVSEAGVCTVVPAHAVQAVDATGAGDCFDGNYLARRALGDDPVTAARWASAAAALATTGFGAVGPLPTAADVRRLLALRHPEAVKNGNPAAINASGASSGM
jgi:2-dehydro-3-deoxygluconokinase